jgi:hypothetical protein
VHQERNEMGLSNRNPDNYEFDRLFDKAMANKKLTKKEKKFFIDRYGDIDREDDGEVRKFLSKQGNFSKYLFIENHINNVGHYLIKINYYSKYWCKSLNLYDLHDKYHSDYYDPPDTQHGTAFRDFKFDLINSFYDRYELNKKMSFEKNSVLFNHHFEISIKEYVNDIILFNLIQCNCNSYWDDVKDKLSQYGRLISYISDKDILKIHQQLFDAVCMTDRSLDEDQIELISSYGNLFKFPTDDQEELLGEARFINKNDEFAFRLYLMGNKNSDIGYYDRFLEKPELAKIKELKKIAKDDLSIFRNYSLDLFKLYSDIREKHGVTQHHTKQEMQFYLYPLSLLRQHCTNLKTSYTFSPSKYEQSWLDWKDFRSKSPK